MEIAYWKCKTCQGEAAPCFAVVIGASPASVIPTKCLQDADTRPEWLPTGREHMNESITNAGNGAIATGSR